MDKFAINRPFEGLAASEKMQQDSLCKHNVRVDST